ncbi:uncharacterized protein LOC143578340 [Bidens hawaiensis]|uniref:uncharacterized protein LOC143578340 n=1 Tax=Bidens hawaiensis TaxID=980011 RepID=UPI00404AF57A
MNFQETHGIKPADDHSSSSETEELTFPTRANEFIQIKMPPTPPPLPRFHKKANVAASPETCSSRNASLKKKLLPKLSFKNKYAISDVIIPAASRFLPREKPSITRSWSLTKMFTKMTTPFQPFTHNGHSDPEHGMRRSGSSVNLQTKVQDDIRRSQSVPILSENTRMKRTDSFFRLIPTASHAKDFDVVTPAPIPTNDGKY